MTSVIKSITKTSQLTDVVLTSTRAAQATKIYTECCKKLAELIKTNPEQYGLSDSISIEELIKLIPEPTFNVKKSKSKKSPAKKKLAVEDWKTVNTKEELSSLKITDLKNILSENSLPLSGNKTILLARVWGILRPEEAPVEPAKKKRAKSAGKKSKASVCTIEDSDSEQVNDEDDIQNLLENRKVIYINKETRKICDKSSDQVEEFQLVDKKKWVFKEDDDNFEYVGILENNKLILGEAPKELYELYAEEE